MQGYLQFIGENEPDNRQELNKYSRRHLRNIAMRIGRGCIAAANHNANAARRVWRRAMRDSESALVSSRRATNIGRAAVQLNLIADMLAKREDLEASTAIRREIHAQNTQDVRYLYDTIRNKAFEGQETKRKASNIRGELAQKVVLGLVTRYAHPWIMATSSLLHHDSGAAKRNNYDMLVVESMPGNAEKTQAYKVQVKTDCAGLCCDRPKRRKPQQLYNEDIIIVSACCDLQRGDHRDTGLVNFRAADLLIREYEETITPSELHELDALSDSLILSITMGDQRRMGTLPIQEHIQELAYTA